MFWLTLSIALILAAAVGAVLLRHPGVMLYDWIASRRISVRARPAAPVAQPSPRADERPGRPVLAG